jgi:iron complex outermembrane receptor protein
MATSELILGHGITLTSITDYQHLSNDFVVDENATPANLFDYEIDDKGSHQISQELRLNGTTQNLKWVTGLYYLNIDHDIMNVTNLYNDSGFGVLLPAAYQQHTQSFAIFSQGDYDLTNQLTVSLGLRGINDLRYPLIFHVKENV